LVPAPVIFRLCPGSAAALLFLPLRRVAGLSQPGIKAGLDRCADALDPVVAHQSVCGSGVFERTLDPAAIKPAAGNEAAELEGGGVEAIIAAASGCGAASFVSSTSAASA
jgi:hypothetical protein